MYFLQACRRPSLLSLSLFTFELPISKQATNCWPCHQFIFQWVGTERLGKTTKGFLTEGESWAVIAASDFEFDSSALPWDRTAGATRRNLMRPENEQSGHSVDLVLRKQQRIQEMVL